tara:strand:+ start:1139 stop:1759 length:621 start_codon:yes stop_codon:yes gene_type:complete
MNEQGTDGWLADRLGKVTASKISDVMMAKTTAGYSNYRAQLICERLTGEPTETFKSAAMDHGTETEPRARAMYELECHETVSEVGMVPHPTLAMSGASPDGIVGDLGLVEIKCPQQAEHVRTLTGGKIKKGYMLQMQWQMECTGRTFCDFVSFNPTFPIEMQLHRTRVDADAELQAEIKTAVTSFLAEVDALEADLRTKFEQKEAA